MSVMHDVTTPILRPGRTKEEYLEAAMQVRTSIHTADIPSNLQEGLVRYFLDGIRPGDFLLAVLKNDLRDAVSRAVDPSVLGPLVMWLNNCVPAPSWGDARAVEAWISQKAEERGTR